MSNSKSTMALTFGNANLMSHHKCMAMNRNIARVLPREGWGQRRGSPGMRVQAVSAEKTEEKLFSAFDRVSVLSEALPYLQKFRGKTIVIKYGGAAMKDESLKARVVTDLALLATVGIYPVLVHGGGPEINIWLGKLGIEPNFKNGLRVTDADTMDVVEMVLGARVNKSLVNLIQQAGGQAVGLCGKDNDTILARQMIEKDIGFVGEVTSVNAGLVESLTKQGYIPVVATVASDGKGQALNVNADTAAGEIAAALKAEKLILMTDVPGVLHDKDDPDSIYAELSIRKCNELVEEGIIAGG